MLSVRACKSLLFAVALAATPAVASRTHRAPTSGHHHKASAKRVKHVHVIQGQRGIDSDRARAIQTALIRQNYMTGVPSGQWDADTESAMVKFQSDHGWQTKLTPDSRALIMLGLGPNHDAMSAQPANAVDAPAANALPDTNTLASTHSISN